MDGSLGIGVVGTGWVAGEHIKGVLATPGCRLVALCDVDAERLRARGEASGVQALYADYAAFLRQPDLDAVIISTPNYLHAEQGIRAAEAGKHVLIEKPAAITLESLRALQRAIKRAGVTSLVGHVMRWNPYLMAAKQLVDTGALGRLFYAEVDYRHRVGP